MYTFPMHFHVHAQSPDGTNTLWQTQTQLQNQVLDCAIPKEFHGPGGAFSPEDFYSLALTNCFIATFKVFAVNSKLQFTTASADGTLTVDRNEKGQPWMAKFHLKILLTGCDNLKLAERVFEKTKLGCLILNSVNTAKSFELHLQ